MNVSLRGLIAGIGIWGGTSLVNIEGLAILGLVVLCIGTYNLGVLTAIAEEYEA